MLISEKGENISKCRGLQINKCKGEIGQSLQEDNKLKMVISQVLQESILLSQCKMANLHVLSNFSE